MQLPYDPAITLLEIYPREMKTYVHSEIYTEVFIVMLFVIAPNWTQPWYPSSGEWLNKLWYIHTIPLLSNEKNKLLLLNKHTQVNLQKIILNGKTQSRDSTYVTFLKSQNQRNGKD